MSPRQMMECCLLWNIRTSLRSFVIEDILKNVKKEHDDWMANLSEERRKPFLSKQPPTEEKPDAQDDPTPSSSSSSGSEESVFCSQPFKPTCCSICEEYQVMQEGIEGGLKSVDLHKDVKFCLNHLITHLASDKDFYANFE